MTIETQNDIVKLQIIGKIVADTLKHMINEARVGMTTLELDHIGASYLEKFNAKSAPKLTYNFPGTTCISVNEDIAHGIPGDKVLRDGDIINIDVSAELDGYFADTGGSFVLGKSSDIQKKVMRATREALNCAIAVATAGKPINQIGRAIEKVAKKYNLKIIENLGSHGVGRSLHEEPTFIAPYFDSSDQRLLKEGQVITIEPFLSTKTKWVEEAKDGWTLFTEPGSVSAQYEHSMIITKYRPIILT
ncbi:MAG: type I methionyl aminopeptidase [Bdellovibrio sp. CG12_big_fil_rev_8_21_14_0_65_39_13]|nr:MAG: type I methionyl aminopeptidase [Bdellovibrio sp. CG22_combo_CG10-13_8_21_14_all_39_27]PIQ58536.1 MAG: type I methionyl aminopeptidase [Bdellovibrio sp. CG12_big_fil_rev_8_21_14_0_65_39_13]PIR34155.1 MAG: type I methionyl aminopeptidase [Bdellovibrio sp. CG11_big_fil_rev_8_21_14_0_20_39_38]